MSCKIPWDSELILSSFTKVFFQTEYRKHREKVLFEHEKSLMPATQQQMREESLRQELALLVKLSDLYTNNVKGIHYKKEAQKIADELGVSLDGAGSSTAKKESKARPMLKCINEKCNGFVMSNNWRCGMCEMKICHECLKEDADDHECTEDDKETCKLILKNTKPCPKCGMMINKIDGCNLMWCVLCHTSFDWASGEMTTGRNHNPHYYEWLRRSGKDVPREPGDVPQHIDCGETLPDPYLFSRAIAPKYSTDDCGVLLGLLRLAIHIQSVELHSLGIKMRELNNTSLRKAFLRGNLTEEAFTREIFIRERTRERSQAIHNVMTVAYTQLRDVMLAFYNGKPSFEASIMELTQLMEYCNDCFAKVGNAYNIKPYKITSSKNFYWITRAK